MNKNFIFGQQFIDYIKTMIPGAHEVSGGTEIVCRCRYCPDSRDPNHGHMYIKVPQESDDPILFHCFKCQTSGALDSRTLLDWGIYDPNIAVTIDKINKKAAKSNKFIGYTKDWYNFYNYISNPQLAQSKVDYINNRLGTSLTINDCIQDKIVLNLSDCLNAMNLQYTRHPNIVNQLNQYFVGFLSLDNNFVNLRRMCNEGIVYNGIDKRYINYNIHGKKDNTEKMYILHSNVDLTSPKRIQIHIAEGPFDILSIKHNLRSNEPNSIYAAITGSGYKGLIMHIINTFQIFYFDLHVYPDNDDMGSKDMINELIDIVDPFNATLYEHRNLFPGEKDFGVPLYRINETIITHKSHFF